MGASRSLLAALFLFSFCFTTGCALQGGNFARPSELAVSLDQFENATTSVQAPEFLPENFSPSVSLPSAQAIDEQNLPATSSEQLPSKRTEAPRNSSGVENHAAAGKSRNESVISAPKIPSADVRLFNLIDRDLDNALEQPPERRRLEFSKAVINHPRVRYFINYFAKQQREHLVQALSRSGRYLPMMARILREAGLPDEFVYLALIESNFQTGAVSPAGAVGIWQFVAGTGRQYGLTINSWVDERRDPVKSTRAAAAYLKDLHDYFGRWYLATAAYNAGQSAVEKATQAAGRKDFWGLSNKGRITEETRNFVPRFVAVALIAQNPKKYGFDSLNYDVPVEYEEVEVGGNISLAKLAEVTGSPLQSIQDLNPELLQPHTPPGESTFAVKLPAGTAYLVAQLQKDEPDAQPAEIVMHEVRKGETLLSIARHYGQQVRALMKMNGLRTSTVRVGQKLTVMLKTFSGTLR